VGWEALERGGEDGVGFDGAGGRLIELGERKRRAQFEAARALLFRDTERRQEGFCCRRGIGGVLLEQGFASHAVQFGVEGAMTGPLGRRQRFVEEDKRAIHVACSAFTLGKPCLEEPVEQPKVLFAQLFCAATHILEAHGG
jgi:hypothetical protein